jgi:hypothetical protein
MSEPRGEPAVLYVVVSFDPSTGRVVGSWADFARAREEADAVPGAYVYAVRDGGTEARYRSGEDA